MSPISSPSFDSFVGPPVAPVATASASADLNWLMTWLGQAAPVLEGNEGTIPKTVESAYPKPVQWLTLLPAVPAMQDLLVPAPVDPPVLAPNASTEAATEEVPIADGPPEEEPENGEANIAVVDVSQPFIAAPVFQPLKVAVDPVAEPATASPAEPRKPPVPAAAVELRQPAEKLPPPVPNADKGELIWAADFVVGEKAPQTAERDTAPRMAGAPGASISPAKAITFEAVPRREDSSMDAREQSEGEHRQGEKQLAQPAPEKSPDRPAPEEADHQEARPIPSAMKPEGSPVGPSAPVNVRIPHAASGNATEASPALAAGSVDLDAARPLRPAQIATLYVDVPAAAGSDDTGTIRLAVTQRGEQVNVRLRSWDAGAAPIENERMQPLLQSLSEQGYEAAKKSIEQLDGRGAQAMEKVTEKPLVTADTANTNNGQQSFQNADDRQRRNQERQQLAFLLRRQTQSLTTEQFDLQAQLDGFNSAQQQGAVR